MRKILICNDSIGSTDTKLSFKVKIELAKMLDNLGVSVIEIGPMTDAKADSLLFKSIASSVKTASVASLVDIMNPDSALTIWNSIKDAAHPRLQVRVPVSTVQMEYFCHKKPQAILDVISSSVKACRDLCPEVEFIASDFGRSEKSFLLQAVSAAVASGANVITLADATGDFLPEEFLKAVEPVKSALPEGVRLGVFCANDLHLADACALEAVKFGADEIKTSIYGRRSASLKRFPAILHAKAALCDADSDISLVELQQTVDMMRRMCESCLVKSPSTRAARSHESDGIRILKEDDLGTVISAVSFLGYDLDQEDGRRVFEAVQKAAESSGEVDGNELDAIVASVAFQVPPTYHLESYVINSGNVITATCHLRLRKDGKILDSVCVGDGPVDASFLAIEKLVGCNYELEDFQIRSVTRGRQAMGQTVVRLRHEGKLFAGSGVSTDIIGSSIMAYLNAVNKMAYSEEQQ